LPTEITSLTILPKSVQDKNKQADQEDQPNQIKDINGDHCW